MHLSHLRSPTVLEGELGDVLELPGGVRSAVCVEDEGTVRDGKNALGVGDSTALTEVGGFP
jgi:hypothetical protein